MYEIEYQWQILSLIIDWQNNRIQSHSNLSNQTNNILIINQFKNKSHLTTPQSQTKIQSLIISIIQSLFTFIIIFKYHSKIHNTFTMKYQKQRNNQIVADKYEVNQEFLTFRNNPMTQNTGRSVYSQQFDYKSLQKYKKEEDELEYHTNARRNMKNMRSQDKYRQIKEQIGLYPKIDQNNNESSSMIDHIGRNNQLKIKYGKLLKLIKKQQKINQNLSQEIVEIKEQINENNERLQKNNGNIQQLHEIEKQNSKNCLQIVRKQQLIREKQGQYKSRLQYLQASINQLKLIKKNENTVLNNYPKKINQGIKDLQICRDALTTKIQYFKNIIDAIKHQINDIQHLDLQLRYSDIS